MFKRKPYERKPIAPPKPLGRPVREAVIGLEFTAMPKELPERSESYRRWVATLCCAQCGINSFSQAAHPNSGRGLGQKASDLDCFPLCCTRPGVLGCHAEHDRLIGMSLEERRSRETRYTTTTRAAAAAIGRPEFSKKEG